MGGRAGKGTALTGQGETGRGIAAIIPTRRGISGVEKRAANRDDEAVRATGDTVGGHPGVPAAHIDGRRAPSGNAPEEISVSIRNVPDRNRRADPKNGGGEARMFT